MSYSLFILCKEICSLFYFFVFTFYSGESTFVDDPVSDAPWLLDISYYVEELSALIHHLQLYEFYLYGHAWGAVIVQG